eukprot:3297345-Pyramimonas_sp.AAC.1
MEGWWDSQALDVTRASSSLRLILLSPEGIPVASEGRAVDLVMFSSVVKAERALGSIFFHPWSRTDGI